MTNKCEEEEPLKSNQSRTKSNENAFEAVSAMCHNKLKVEIHTNTNTNTNTT